MLEVGELIPVAEAGVHALAVGGQVPTADGDLLVRHGARFADGSRHPLVDWFTRPHQPDDVANPSPVR